MTPGRRVTLTLAAAAALLMLGPSRVLAQDPVQKIIQLNKKALEDYDILEFESAKRALLEAVNAGKKAGLDSHVAMARTYVHLGILYINGFKDRFKGFQQFQKAIQIQGDIKLDKSLASPELAEVFDSALEDARAKGTVGPAGAKAGKAGAAATAAPGKKAAPLTSGVDDEAAALLSGKKPAAPAATAAAPPPGRPAGKKPAAPVDEDEDAPRSKKGRGGRSAEPKEVEIDEPDLPANIAALDCPNADEAPPEKDIALRCAIGPGLAVSKVFLFYRPAGKEDFTPVPMVKSKKGWWNGVIPANVVSGKSLQFYYEGRDKAGKPIVSNGRGDSPNLMIIREGAKVVGSDASAILKVQSTVPTVDLPESENPLEEKTSTGPKLILGKQERPKDTRRAIGDRTLWIGIAGGSGIGFSFGGDPMSNTGPEYRTDLAAPTAVAVAYLLHGAGEIGFYLNPQLALSLQSRNQWIPQPGTSGAARGAHAGLLRVLYFLGTAQSRLYASAMAGGGEGFRLVIKPDKEYSPDFKDTVRGGPVIGGLGFGFTYDFTPSWAWVAEANLLAGAPRLAAVVDFNTGIQMGF